MIESEVQSVAVPTQVTCPQGHTVPVRSGRTSERYLADFPAAECAQCPLREQCPTEPLRQRPMHVLRVTQRQVAVAQARQACDAVRTAGPPYLRPAVEATVRSIKHPFGDERGQLPVRGQPRVTMMVIASGVMLNLRRIWRYRQAQRTENRKNQPASGAIPESTPFSSRWRETLAYGWALMHRSSGWRALPYPC